MKKIIVPMLLLLSIDTARAEGYYIGAAYDFIPGSGEISLGYQAKNLAFEAVALNRGKEEPLTKPGPQISLNILAPVRPLSIFFSLPIFFKVGVVSGTGKKGYNVGGGVDLALNARWAIRTQVTHYRVTEDFGQGVEAENLISSGVKYQF